MGSIFSKPGRIDESWDGNKTDAERRHAQVMVALLEIRGAIDAQTDRGAGEWDESAFARLAHATSATQDTTSALAHLLNDLVPRVAALENKLAVDVARVDQASGAQLHAIHNGQERLAALEAKAVAVETALANIMFHQQETAKLLTELAGRVAGLEK